MAQGLLAFKYEEEKCHLRRRRETGAVPTCITNQEGVYL